MQYTAIFHGCKNVNFQMIFLKIFFIFFSFVEQPSVGEERANLSAGFTCNYVVSVWRDFLFLWVLGMGYVILLWHSLSLPYNYFAENFSCGYTLEPPH